MIFSLHTSEEKVLTKLILVRPNFYFYFARKTDTTLGLDYSDFVTNALVEINQFPLTTLKQL